jgi:hypothetical protein
MQRLKMKWIAGAAAAIAVMSLASGAGAATLSSTGVLGVGSPELNWTLVSPAGTLTGVSGAQDYPGAWVVAPPGSNWITPFAATGTTATDAPVGSYHYSLSFADPLVPVAIQWSSDNDATFSLNSTPLSTTGSTGYSSLVSFLIPAASFQGGLNFFDVFVQNDPCDGCANPTGLLVSVSATPLPAALPLFATGLGALGLLARRKKKKAAALAA